MKRIGIIGGGFTGTMTAIQLIHKLTVPCEILLINENETLSKGVAYNPYSDKHLLNVSAGKMSAYPDNPGHFLDWVISTTAYNDMDRYLLSRSFLPRRLYGEYLVHLWKDACIQAASKNISLSVIQDHVKDLETNKDEITLSFSNQDPLIVDYCIIAAGNAIPGNPKIENSHFYQSKNYFKNPWEAKSVLNIRNDLPVLIIGNGLTMVDTVLGAVEQGFKGRIYSVSPHGFNILPHKGYEIPYSRLIDELIEPLSLHDLVKLVNKHIKRAAKYGIPAEVVIDSLRPHTQKIWSNFSDREKAVFMARLRHLWGVARHRLPLNSYNVIQKLRMEERLHIVAGKLINLHESDNHIQAEYLDKKINQVRRLQVSRVINCTGPETNIMNLENNFLKNCLLKGILVQDPLKLGIRTHIPSFKVIHSNGTAHPNLFAVGTHLKGALWESTAVNELRVQAEDLAQVITEEMSLLKLPVNY